MNTVSIFLDFQNFSGEKQKKTRFYRNTVLLTEIIPLLIIKSKSVSRPETQKEQVRQLAEETHSDSQIYKQYQANVAKTEELQSQILKGIIAGEDCYHLMLIAIKAISLMTSNMNFYNQAVTDSRMVYGDVLGRKEPLQDRLQEVKDRLVKVRAAVDAEEDPQLKDRLRRSAEAHEERIKELEKEIAAGENS